MAFTLTSAAGALALLHDTPELQVYALTTLNAIVDQFWAEISDALPVIEALHEDTKFDKHTLAALVASKVYYHLGDFDGSLTYALGAGALFDIHEHSAYVQTIIARAIDKYIHHRKLQYAGAPDGDIDPRLEAIVKGMFDRCFADKEYKQAVGIALEALRLDIVEKAINASDKSEMLAYVLDTTTTLVENIQFRDKVLQLLADLYRTLPEPDYVSIAQCLTTLGDASGVADLLKSLVAKDANHTTHAFQVAFDVEDSATQDFVSRILDLIPDPDVGLRAKTEEPTAADMAVDANEATGSDEKKPLLKAEPLAASPEDPLAPTYRKLRRILSGEAAIQFYLDFLVKNNHGDLQILKQTKEKFESRNSVHHSGLSFANAFMSAGTTSDDFLRQNLDWLRRASNWSKFSATAAFGVIHKGQLKQGRALLEPYLPRHGVTGSTYSEGGALFALGLIHSNHGAGVVDYLCKVLDSKVEVVQHGACLGLGVAGMATASEDIYENLKQILFSESAVAGEAAALAIGLIMLGTANQAVIDEMLLYTQDTKHEKIIRGCAIGVALIMYGRQEQADVLIERLLADKDPILRYGGVHTVAMAYAGTGNNKAVEKLLHVAVSDVNDDVRRAAVASLGFILFNMPNQVPRVVELLSESYNPHVRYGSALALGIACAGTGMKEALDLLDPMLNDTMDYVRQGALIAYAMIVIQHNEVQTPKVAQIRKQFATIIGDGHEDLMAQFGAVLGQGIIDAGGRNVTISLKSRSGATSMSAVVGMVLFTQFWYWYPLAHFLSLAFTPTAIIGVDSEELKLVESGFEVVSNSRPSMFAYPPPIKQQTEVKIEKVATAVLSTTNKTIQRAKKQKKSEGGMDVDEDKEQKDEAESEKKVEEAAAAAVAAAVVEPETETITNGSRVTPSQLEHIALSEKSTYLPVRRRLGGIMVLRKK